MNGWQAFRSGLSLSLRYRQVVLVLFVVNLISALLLATLPALILASGLGHRPAIREAADSVDAWLVLETMVSPLTSSALEQDVAESGLYPDLGQMVLIGLLIAVALPFVAWLPAAFLKGGMLLAYVEAIGPGAHGQDPPPFRWRRFLWGCWHWWGAFLLLGAVQAFAFVVVVIPATVVGVLAVSAVGPWLAWVVVPLLGLVVVLGLMFMEWTRILAVATGTQNVFRAFGRAARFVFHHLLPVIGLYGLSLLLVGVLHAVYRLGLMPVLPLDWWLLVLLVQQTFILARLLTRLARLAGGVTLFSESAPVRRRALSQAT